MLAQPCGADRPAHNLDNAAAAEWLQEYLGPGQFVLGQLGFQLGEPLLAEAEYQLASRPAARIAENSLHRFEKLLQLVGQFRKGTRIELFHLVEKHNERLSELLFFHPPGRFD